MSKPAYIIIIIYDMHDSSFKKYENTKESSSADHKGDLTNDKNAVRHWHKYSV